MKYCVLMICCCWMMLASCNSNYTPKPKGYYKISFPEKKYQKFAVSDFPYEFEYPIYAQVEKDTSFFDEAPENPYWINIHFPEFHGTIFISYKDLRNNNFNQLINDAFNLTNKHSSKAYSIEDSLVITPNQVKGIFFKVGGNVATANQFFLSDSTRHFLRGALYFDATPNEDSLSVVNEFLVQDVKHLINSFRWKQ